MLVAVVATGLLAAGCSSGSSPSASSPIATTTTTPAKARTTAARPGAKDVEPEQFHGSIADFYRVPKPLPGAKPGTVIRVQALPAGTGPDEAGTTSLRVMYHSRDSHDHDRAVTGVVTYPDAKAPADGWPVITSAHGTYGIAPQCAPSRTLTSAPAWGVDGVRVATDYIGLGPVGELHPYLSALDEGHSVLDAVRAARNLATVHAGTRYVIVGHSQGGHAALWAHQLSHTYAPELQLLGTAALAPAAELSKTYGPIDEIVANVVSLMAIYGAAANDPTIKPHDYVGPEVQRQERVLTTSCLAEITKVFSTIPRATFYKARPQDTEPARSMILASDPGDIAVDAPLLILQGDQDIRVHPLRTADLFKRECKSGQVTEYHLFQGADHDSVLRASAGTVEAWLQARFAGAQPANSCPSGKPTVHPAG